MENKHKSEMHRLADAPQGTKTWFKNLEVGQWTLTASPIWANDCIYIINDKWAEIRKAMVDGKTIEYNSDISGWKTTKNSLNYLGETKHQTPDAYRIKPDEPTYYYQYEKKRDNSIVISSGCYKDKDAKASNYTEDNGWFKIESSKREWEH